MVVGLDALDSSDEVGGIGHDDDGRDLEIGVSRLREEDGQIGPRGDHTLLDLNTTSDTCLRCWSVCKDESRSYCRNPHSEIEDQGLEINISAWGSSPASTPNPLTG
jgi:hypothetical protein